MPSEGHPVITGSTELIAHIGWPTHTFKSPQIYNPWFRRAGVDAVVVPMGCRPEGFPVLLKALFSLENLRGALITMPHKVVTAGLVDELSAAARVAGACNAVRRGPDGRLQGDLFDGAGFVRGLRRNGCTVEGASALVVGTGGVGSAIAASLAGAGVAEMALYDARPEAAEQLAARLREHHPALAVRTGSNDPRGCRIVVNATPLGMHAGDPMPLDVSRLQPDMFVGEVVMRAQMTGFLQAAAARGCAYQVGTDMLYEQIPAYLEYFGLPVATAAQLREGSALRSADASP